MKCPDCEAEAALVDIIENHILLEQRVMCDHCGLDEHHACDDPQCPECENEE